MLSFSLYLTMYGTFRKVVDIIISFAKRYNGPVYVQNKYDEKQMKTYLKHKG